MGGFSDVDRNSGEDFEAYTGFGEDLIVAHVENTEDVQMNKIYYTAVLY